MIHLIVSRLQIFIMLPSGKTLKFYAALFDPIFYLKEQIFQKEGIKIDQQILLKKDSFIHKVTKRYLNKD